MKRTRRLTLLILACAFIAGTCTAQSPGEAQTRIPDAVRAGQEVLVYIAPEARKTLKPGDNTLVVRTVAKADALDVSAGLIDWKWT